MGMIKLPEASVDFFKENIDEIFSSGNLARAWSCGVKNLLNHTPTPNSQRSAIQMEPVCMLCYPY